MNNNLNLVEGCKRAVPLEALASCRWLIFENQELLLIENLLMHKGNVE